MAINSITDEGAFTNASRKIANDNFRDVSRCTTQVDVADSTTLVNVTGMVTGVLLPGTYEVDINLLTTAGASGGVKAALKWGTASMITSTAFNVNGLAAAAIANTKFTTSTDAASIIAATTAYVGVRVTGTIVIAKSGTLQLQIAQNASNGTATSALVGSHMTFTPIGATIIPTGTLGY
jgi:hypothetical protein